MNALPSLPPRATMPRALDRQTKSGPAFQVFAPRIPPLAIIVCAGFLVGVLVSLAAG